MKGIFLNKPKTKRILLNTGAFYLALAIFFIGIPTTFAAVGADIKANGSDGPITINNGDSWDYSWTSTDSTACTLSSPTGDSGISLSGSGGPIPSGHPWYPSTTTSTTLTLNCTDGTLTTTDSVVIQLAIPAPPGGGGGGGGGGSSGGSSRPSSSTTSDQVLGASTVSDFCPYLLNYLRIGLNNDSIQVIRLQAFLKTFEKFDYVTVNGVFDQATLQAVNEFQLRYKDEILTPWGISQPTGYVYIRTLGKINQILCGTSIQDVHPQVIKDIKAPVNKEMGGYKEDAGTSTLSSIPLIGQDISKGQIPDKPDKGHPDSLAAALFTWPDTGAATVKCLYQFLLILIVLYILGSIMENVLYKDIPENVLKKFHAKWGTIIAGLALSFVGAYMLEFWCLLLPLLIAFIASVIWMITKQPSRIKSKEVVKETTTRSVIITDSKK